MSDKTLNSFNTKFISQSKDQESGYQVTQNLVPYFNLIALVLGYNCVERQQWAKYFRKVQFSCEIA